MQHSVNLSPLLPDTRYSYRVLDASGQRLAQSTFSTAPRRGVGKTIRFAVIGDSGTGSTAQYRVAIQMQLWRPNLLIHTGDLVYPAGEEKDYTANFFLPYLSILPRIPLMPSIGNHDAMHVDDYLSVFLPPSESSKSATKRYYSFNYGNAHVVALDSTLPLTSDSTQRHWLEADLTKSTTRSQRWRIVFFHHPPFSAGPHGDTTTIQEELIPLFEQHGVDAVFSGHDHAYERTARYSSTGDPHTSILYVVSGGGGADLYAQLGPHPLITKYESRYHFVGIRLSRSSLNLQAIADNGTVLDSFRLAKP